MTQPTIRGISDEEIHAIEALENSHWWYRGMREIHWALMMPLLPVHSLHILDIGCGTGGNMRHLASLGSVQGVDPSPLCIHYCREKGLDCHPGSMSDLGGLQGPFDLVTMFDVLYQAEPSQMASILSGIHRVLAPNGVLTFREPAMAIAGGAHDRAVGLRKRFTTSDVRVALAGAGFEPLRITYLNTLLFPAIVLRRRLGDLLAGRSHIESDLRPAGPAVNALLLAILRLEKQLLRLGDSPFGVSVFAAARKAV